MLSYDEIFKRLMKHYFEPFATVITDYEIVNLPKKADILIIEMKEKFEKRLTLFKYFKKYNGIEFKSFADPFKMNEDEYRLGIYINGILLQEKEANKDNTTFTLVSSRKPQKLLDEFKEHIVEIEPGHYLIESVSLIPVHVLVIKELGLSKTREVDLLKEFTIGEDLENFIRKMVREVKNKGIDEYFECAMMMHREEMLTVMKEEGFTMTVVEKNLREWNKLLGIDEDLKKEGIKEEKINTAKNLHKMKMSIDLISQATGLSIAELKKILK